MNRTAVPVARMYGRSAGRFLATSILEVLGDGAGLALVERAESRPRSAVDFGFSGADSWDILRAAVDEMGVVVAAETLKAQVPMPARRYRAIDALAGALREGGLITMLRWDVQPARPPGLLLLMLHSDVFRLDLTNFDDLC